MNYLRKLSCFAITLIALFFWSIGLSAQQLERKITTNIPNGSLENALLELKKNSENKYSL